jgi:hypothetical protein
VEVDCGRRPCPSCARRAAFVGDDALEGGFDSFVCLRELVRLLRLVILTSSELPLLPLGAMAGGFGSLFLFPMAASPILFFPDVEICGVCARAGLLLWRQSYPAQIRQLRVRLRTWAGGGGPSLR